MKTKYRKHSVMLRALGKIKQKSGRKYYFECEERLIAKHYID